MFVILVMAWRRELHSAFDELLAAFFDEHPEKSPRTTTARELMEWSGRQMLGPGGDRDARVAAAINLLDGGDVPEGEA
jgi:hypothetical protein